MIAWLWRLAPSLALVLSLVSAKACYDAGRRREGALREQLRASVARADTLARREDSVRKAYRRDTVLLTKWRQRRDSVVERVVTEFLHDTLPVPVDRVREVVAVDSAALRQCSVVIRTCEAETATLRLERDEARRQRDVFKQQRPGFGSHLKEWGIRLGIGYIGYRLGERRAP